MITWIHNDTETKLHEDADTGFEVCVVGFKEYEALRQAYLRVKFSLEDIVDAIDKAYAKQALPKAIGEQVIIAKRNIRSGI